MSKPNTMDDLRDRLFFEADKALYDLFYKALEGGEDIVLQRQFENDPPAKHRYADRCIKDAKDKIADLITAKLEEVDRAARISELKNFEPFMEDHTNCPMPETCIGYENARSDFDNEKQIRLKELRDDKTI